MPLALFAQALPEPSLFDLGGLFVQAISGKQYALGFVVALLGAVGLARWGGAKVWPWLGTPRGGAVLVAVGGTLSLVLAGLRAGQPLTVDLVLGCFLTAATASGLWSIGKNTLQRTPAPQMAPDKCTPIEIANGTCKP